MKDSLASCYPEIAKEWDDEKNGEKRPEQFAPHSNKKAWWRCKSGHSYEQTIDHRTARGSACPYCRGKKVLEGFNDLKTLAPELAGDWDYNKNGEQRPEFFSLHSNKTAWWKCKICHHEWKTKINDRANGRGCPECAKSKRIQSFRDIYLERGKNDLKTLYPDLAAEWDYEKNGDLKPDDVIKNSNLSPCWKCSICGHRWKATVSNRTNRRSGCPKCSRYRRTSFPEQAILYYVLQFFPKAQNSYKDITTDGKMELDIYIPEIHTGIEYDGKAWHKGKNAERSAKMKAAACAINGIRLIRVSESPLEYASLQDVFVYREDLSSGGLNKAVQETLRILTDKIVDINVERDRDTIMLQYKNVIKEKSITTRFPELMDEWDYEKNSGLTPDMINATSPQKFWWKCKLGHSYKATTANKTVGKSGCPICSGRQCLPGYNDLQTRYPSIAAEWDEEKNAPLRVNEVMPGSMVKYWWRCSKGHSFESKPNSRTSQNSGCPICSNRTVAVGINDLYTTHKIIACRWDDESNGTLTPKMIGAWSTKKVYWKCKKGHTWKRSVKMQVKSDYCPICNTRQLKTGFNDLATSNPDIAKEWDYEKNGGLLPQSVMRTSREKVYWRCKDCGHVWKAEIRTRCNNNSGCPICGYAKKMQKTRADRVRKEKRDLVSLFPEIAAEWDYTQNKGIDPTGITPQSNHKVWWNCPRGHNYEAWVGDRTGKKKTGCPYCAGKRKLMH